MKRSLLATRFRPYL